MINSLSHDEELQSVIASKDGINIARLVASLRDRTNAYDFAVSILPGTSAVGTPPSFLIGDRNELKSVLRHFSIVCSTSLTLPVGTANLAFVEIYGQPLGFQSSS